MKVRQPKKSSPQSVSFERVVVLPPLPVRPLAAHKGTFGRVLVVGGDEAMFGAATLAATAALRMGSGLVQLAAPAKVLPFALSVTPELIGLGLHEKSQKSLMAAADVASGLVIGPGMGVSRASTRRLFRLIEVDKPMLLDADALNLLATAKRWPRLEQALLTPHPGEMLRIAGRLSIKHVPADDRGRLDLAVTIARQLGTVLLLKGNRTVVTDGRRAYVNPTGDNTLSKAGSGDVLSGVIGSLLGQGMNLFEAACAGAWLHGKAGELAGRRYGKRSAVAREVISLLSEALEAYPNQE